ncbi:MAG: WD40/YVTN/BNR-like repeat-containing protein [Chloroflexota bacterium]
MGATGRSRLASGAAAAALVWGALLPAARPAQAAACQYVLGFASLHAQLPGIVGPCVDNEHFNAANGDALQDTANGLLVWRKADNHTAFTNGSESWVNGAYGIETRANGQRFPWESNPDNLPLAADNGPRPAPQPSFNAILFVDAQHGWAAGGGVISATSDGGATWTRQYGGPSTIEQLDVLNPADGFALGRLGQDVLLHTTDGGAHWQPVSEPPQPLNQMHFLSPSVGFGVGGGTLYQTADAGASWRAISTPIPAGGLCFTSPDTGWIVSLGSLAAQASPPPTALAATSDGGISWQQRALPGAIGRFQRAAQQLGCAQPGALWDLFVGQPGAGNEPYVLFRSPDGGQSWQAITGHEISAGVGPAPGAYAGSLSVVSAQAAFLSGYCGACYPPSPTTPPAVAVGSTTDGGRSWHSLAVDTLPPSTSHIAFISDSQGWLVTYGDNARPPEILTTADGGESWTRQYSLHTVP